MEDGFYRNGGLMVHTSEGFKPARFGQIQGRGIYGEPTRIMRVPISFVDTVLVYKQNLRDSVAARRKLKRDTLYTNLPDEVIYE